MCNAHNHSLFCTCGWGGEGHQGKSTGSMHLEWFRGKINSSSFSKQRYYELTTYTFQDSTFASTCRYCGSKIFFVKHNGGIAVFDSLGWPWPKHNCLKEPEPHYFSGQHRQLNEIISASGDFDDKVGIVRSYAWRDHCYCIIEILDKPNKLLYLKLSNKKITIKANDLIMLKRDGHCLISSIDGWTSEVEDAKRNYANVLSSAVNSSLKDKNRLISKGKTQQPKRNIPTIKVKELTESQATEALRRLAAAKLEKLERERAHHEQQIMQARLQEEREENRAKLAMQQLDAVFRNSQDTPNTESWWPD